MFRDDQQACRAIRVLLGSVFRDVDALWPETGPTPLSLRYLKASPLSHGEYLMLQVAFDFWNGHGGAKFADLISVLDQRPLVFVCELATAVPNGPDAVDAWVARCSQWPTQRSDA
jgi:hypothetical protein